MGAVSDLVNIGDTGRFRSWLFAIAIALIGVTAFEWMDVINLDSMRPPYRTANFSWSRFFIGGIMFGIGMTLASGCGNKTLVRIGGGNIKSLLVFLVAGVFAYLMTKTDFYGILFHSWMNPIAIDLEVYSIPAQDLGSFASVLIQLVNVAQLRLIIGIVIAVVLLLYIFKSADFWRSFDNVFGGAIVGAAVLGAWYVTAGPMGQEWMDEVSMMEQIPIGVGAQSYTFINPMGETLDYLVHPTNYLLISFGVMSIAGVVVGSFLYSLITRKFRLEWFANKADFTNHMIGAVMMGIGGVLSMGCTIGQGITGISTLALGSFITFISIVFGSALTMKVQYYKLVYEEEASFSKALTSALVDMKILPRGMRQLDAV